MSCVLAFLALSPESPDFVRNFVAFWLILSLLTILTMLVTIGVIKNYTR